MRRDQAYLEEILKSARKAVNTGRSLSLEEFRSNRDDQLAILKAFEEIGDAAAKISPAVRAEYLETPWREHLFGITPRFAGADRRHRAIHHAHRGLNLGFEKYRLYWENQPPAMCGNIIT